MPVSPCNITIDKHGREVAGRGSAAFPIGCYQDDLSTSQIPWHWHEELEAVIVSEGTLLLGCGSEQYVIHPGEGFFINTGVLHGCWAYRSSRCRIYSIVFHPRLVGGMPDSVFFQKYLHPLMESRASGSLRLSPETPWQAAILKHVHDAWQAVTYEPPGYEFDVWHHLSGIIQLLHHNLPAASEEANPKQQRDAQRIKEMLGFIHDHYSEKITVTEIAQSASISESECLRCFRNTVQLTPIQYLRQFRIRQAANLLDSSSEKISVIANTCGFDDLSFFAKTFRELKGCSPSDYRNRRKE